MCPVLMAPCKEVALLLGVCTRTFRRYVDRHCCHYMKVKVRVLVYTNGDRAIRHGPWELAPNLKAAA